MIEIYGKPQCPFCAKAKEFCEKSNFEYSYKSLGTDFTKEELLEQFPGAQTVPQIKVNGVKIGGYSQLEQYIEETGYNGTGATL